MASSRKITWQAAYGAVMTPRSLSATLLIPSLWLAAAVTSVSPAAEPVPTRELRDLNKSYFPFTPVKSKGEWEVRKEEVKRRILVASGLL